MDYKRNNRLSGLAKSLRNNMTAEERHLWYDFLKGHPARFCRQKILGKYIVDFFSAKANLIIEIDGEHHYETSNRLADAQRTRYLNEYGLSVLRFSNEEIRTNFDGVCIQINLFIENSSTEINNQSPLDRQ